MKYHLLIILTLYGTLSIAQLRCVPLSGNGSGYQSITSSGLDYEDPDCIHGSFGPHITNTFDTILKRNVFIFHSHIDADNDRCETFDRVRMEIKGGPGTSSIAQHPIGTVSYYRWKFFVPTTFLGSSNFCHIFQNKIFGGNDTSLPLITFTLRASTLQLIHSGGSTGNDLGVLAQANLADITGQWCEAYIKQTHGENGKIEVTLRSLKNGRQLINYKNDNIDLWRAGSEYSRPKWGIYRKKASGLKDEQIRFADFCISETAEGQCPAEEITFPPIKAGEPTGFIPTDKSVNIAPNSALRWNEASDANSYNVYFGTSPTPALVTNIPTTFYNATTAENTTYYWRIGAVNTSGETLGPIISFRTGKTTTPSNASWLTYRANGKPHIESTPWMELNTYPDAPEKDTVTNDINVAGNKVYTFHDKSTTNFRYRYRTLPEDTAFTVLMRVKAINDDIKTFMYFEIRANGIREKLRMNTSTLKLERSSPVIEVPWPVDMAKDFHVIRVTLSGNITKVYLDENPEPIAVGESATTDSNTYMEWGKSATQEVGGIIDYFSVIKNVTLDPTQVPKQPSDLIISSDASLSSIIINGTPLAGFNPNTLDYTYQLDENTIPDIQFTKSSAISKAVITLPSKVPGTTATIAVVAQDSVTTRTYKIFLKGEIVGVNDEVSPELSIYPNPASNFINIDFEQNITGELNIVNAVGVVKKRLKFDAKNTIDLSDLAPGIITLLFKTDGGLSFSKQIVIVK